MPSRITPGRVISKIWLIVWLSTASCNDREHPNSSLPWTVSNERVRLVFPSANHVDSLKADRLVAAVEDGLAPRGLPPGVFGDHRITVSLAAQLGADAEARSAPREWLIILPLDALDWAQDKLQRTIRHELAHIGAAAYLRFVAVPFWFREGFAEWVAGGLTCEGETRIRLDLLTRSQRSEHPSELFDPNEFASERLAYDYFTTFVEFLDHRGDGVVTDTRLLESIRLYGVDAGLTQALQVDQHELTKAWRVYLLERY